MASRLAPSGRGHGRGASPSQIFSWNDKWKHKLLVRPRFSSEEDHIIFLLGAEQGFELRLVELGLAVEHCAYLTAHGGWQCLAQL